MIVDFLNVEGIETFQKSEETQNGVVLYRKEANAKSSNFDFVNNMFFKLPATKKKTKFLR